jgi:hypothetical protein
MDKDYVFPQQDDVNHQGRNFTTGYQSADAQNKASPSKPASMDDLRNMEEKFNARILSLSDGLDTEVRWHVREAVLKLGDRLKDAARARRVRTARIVIFFVAAAAVAAEAARFFKFLAS